MMWLRRTLGLLGLIASADVAAQETTTYTYDALGRVIQAAHTGASNPSLTNDYTYDQADNRATQTVTGSSVTPTVTDWSFEIPSVGAGFVYGPTVTGATFQYNSGVAGNGSAWAFTAAPDGTQVGFLQANTNAPVITLSVNNLEIGRSYVVAYQTQRRPSSAATPITVKYGSTSLGTVTPTATTSFQSVVTSAFTAASGVTTISFTGAATTADMSSAIDGVRILAVPTVADFSFEVPSQGGGFTYAPTTQGLTFAPYAGIAANGSAWGFAAAPNGSQVAFLQSPPSGTAYVAMGISGLVQGRNYTATFRIAQRAGYAAVPITVTFNGVSLGTWSPASTAFQVVTTPSFQATGVGGRLAFTVASAAGGPASGLDFVEVNPAP